MRSGVQRGGRGIPREVRTGCCRGLRAWAWAPQALEHPQASALRWGMVQQRLGRAQRTCCRPEGKGLDLADRQLPHQAAAWQHTVQSDAGCSTAHTSSGRPCGWLGGRPSGRGLSGSCGVTSCPPKSGAGMPIDGKSGSPAPPPVPCKKQRG